ncbi:MAG: alpha/beta hydrolase [Dehalococcoidia bacterium]
MGAMTTTTVATQAGGVQLRRGGSGEPLVYLHSAGGEGEGLALLDRLAERFDVVAPMFPGFGESEGIEQIDDMEDAVFHLLDLFEQLDLVSPAVLGMSLGGWMGIELATRYPERVSKLVVVNPAGLYIEGAEIKDLFGRSPAEMAEDLFADQSHPMAQMMHQVSVSMSQAGGSALAIPFDLLKPQLQTMAATARLAWDPYLHNPKLRKRLHRITAPTLVIRGKEDTLIPAAHAQAYAREIPGAKLVEMPNAAHLIAVERPDELAELVIDFLSS